MAFSVDKEEFVGGEQGEAVLFPATQLIFGLGRVFRLKEFERQSQLLWARWAREEQAVGEVDSFRIAGPFRLDSIREGLRAIGHKWAVEDKQLLLWNRGHASRGGRDVGVGEVEQTQQFVQSVATDNSINRSPTVARVGKAS